MSKKCPACGYDNRDTAAFCAQCQTQLPGNSGGWAPSGTPALPGPSVMGAAPQASLIGAGQRFPILGGTTLVGRNSGCQIVLDDASVSTNHAEINWDGAQYVVHDLGSTNGTWVNQRRVTAITPLASGAQVFFGTVGFAFEIAGAAGVSQPSERHEQAPPNPARTLVTLAVVVLFVGVLLVVIAIAMGLIHLPHP